jgi:hypothetical protein
MRWDSGSVLHERGGQCIRFAANINKAVTGARLADSSLYLPIRPANRHDDGSGYKHAPHSSPSRPRRAVCVRDWPVT